MLPRSLVPRVRVRARGRGRGRGRVRVRLRDRGRGRVRCFRGARHHDEGATVLVLVIQAREGLHLVVSSK